jgi:hypothetical protein
VSGALSPYSTNGRSCNLLLGTLGREQLVDVPYLDNYLMIFKLLRLELCKEMFCFFSCSIIGSTVKSRIMYYFLLVPPTVCVIFSCLAVRTDLSFPEYNYFISRIGNVITPSVCLSRYAPNVYIIPSLYMCRISDAFSMFPRWVNVMHRGFK